MRGWVGRLENGDFLMSSFLDAPLEIIKSFMEEHSENIDFYGFKISHIIKFIEFIFQNNYLENQGTYYKILFGLSTGGHSSTIIADIIINYTYLEAIKTVGLNPKNLKLFVDDSLGIWVAGMETFNSFLEGLNNVWDSINCVPSCEDENKSIIFLDIKVSIDENWEIQHTHYVKPTSSNTYLHFLSHSPMSTKINIIKTEADRIIRNCSKLEFIYDHLENLKTALIKSGYPSNLIDQHIVPKIQKAELGNYGHNSIINKKKEREIKQKQREQANNKDEFILTIPHVNEAYTRKMKAGIKNNGINARVVVQSGLKLKSLIKTKKVHECNCISCVMNIPCNKRNFVYQAECLHCDQKYIGASHRPGKERLKEYESSIRLTNQAKRTTLGRHKMESHSEKENNLASCYKFSVI